MKWWHHALIAVGLIIPVIVGAAVVLYRAHPAAPVVTSIPDSLRAKPAQAAPAKLVPEPPPAVVVEDPKDAEIERLRRENATLKRGPAVGQNTASNSIPTIEEVKEFGTHLAATIQERELRNWSMATISLSGFDIKHSDSLIHPIVAEVTINKSLLNKGALTIYRVDRYKLHFWRDNGSWKLLDGESRCESYATVPKMDGNDAEVGRIVTLSENSLKEVIDAAQLSLSSNQK